MEATLDTENNNKWAAYAAPALLLIAVNGDQMEKQGIIDVVKNVSKNMPVGLMVNSTIKARSALDFAADLESGFPELDD